MLKLEKVSKTLAVSVTLRKKEPWLSKDLLFALLFAASLHIAAGFFFNIRPFLLRGSQTLLHPVQVEAVPLPPADAAVQVEVEGDLLPRTVREPQKSEPVLPDWPHHEPLIVQAPLWKHNPFPKTPFLPPLDHPAAPQGVHLHFIGALADAQLLHSPSPPVFAYQGRFLVRLEGRTGRLFWFEPLQYNPQDHLIEKWLKEFQFQPNLDLFVEGGEVEVQIG